MSASLEAYLARLYLDAEARRRFVTNPRAAATDAGLSESDARALESIDRVGLELAARSLAAKRGSGVGRSRVRRMLDRLRSQL